MGTNIIINSFMRLMLGGDDLLKYWLQSQHPCCYCCHPWQQVTYILTGHPRPTLIAWQSD